MAAPDARTRALQGPSTAAIMASHTEPSQDMVEERKRATFNVQELKVRAAWGFAGVLGCAQSCLIDGSHL